MGQFPVAVSNGNRFGYSSIDFRPIGRRITGIKDFGYKASLKPGNVWGTSAFRVGRTRGQFESSGSITFFREEWGDFLAAISQLTSVSNASPFGDLSGYMEVSWDCSIAYAETPTSPVQSDSWVGARMTDIDVQNAEGPEALLVKVELDIMMVRHLDFNPLNVVII